MVGLKKFKSWSFSVAVLGLDFKTLVGSWINDVITKRLTIIRTQARGNIPGWKEMVAGDKGKHSYYKQKRYSALWSGGEYSTVEEKQRDWKTAEELLQGYGILWGHGVVTRLKFTGLGLKYIY